jgi:hypothetical protein
MSRAQGTKRRINTEGTEKEKRRTQREERRRKSYDKVHFSLFLCVLLLPL